MSNYQGRLSTRQLTIFIYFYSHWHFFNIFVTVWQPWAIISLRQNSGHTVTLKISYSSTENQKKISKLMICLAGPSDPSETISSDLIKVCCLSMSNFSNVNNSPFHQVERNCGVARHSVTTGARFWHLGSQKFLREPLENIVWMSQSETLDVNWQNRNKNNNKVESRQSVKMAD